MRRKQYGGTLVPVDCFPGIYSHKANMLQMSCVNLRSSAMNGATRLMGDSLVVKQHRDAS